MRLTMGAAFFAFVAMAVGASGLQCQAWAEWRSLDIPIAEPPANSADSQPWSLSGPRLALGLIDGPPAYLFTHIWDAELTADGRVVVVEATDHEIRVFDEEGRHHVTFGGQGGGPEEFGGPPWISLSADTLLVWDPGHYRVSRFSLDGELIDQVTVREEVLEAGIGQFPNGLVWETSKAGQLWTGGVSLRPREGLNIRLRRFVLMTADGFRDLGTFRSGLTYFMAMDDGSFRGIADPFAPASVAAVSPEGRVAISDGEHGDVLIFGVDGQPELLLGAAVPRLPVNSDAAAEYRRRLPGTAAQLNVPLRRLEAAHAAIPVSDSIPAISDVLWGGDGALWVGRRSGDILTTDEYHVFTPDGRWRARVVLPEGIDAVLAVGADYVLARHRGELGMQSLHLYTLVR